MTESDFSSDEDDDNEHRDEHGRKRVAVIDCLLESSSPSSPEDNTDDGKWMTNAMNDVLIFLLRRRKNASIDTCKWQRG